MGIKGWIFFHGQGPPYQIRNQLLEAAVAALPLTEDLIRPCLHLPSAFLSIWRLEFPYWPLICFQPAKYSLRERMP